MLFIDNSIILPTKIFLQINLFSNDELQTITQLKIKPDLIREYCYLLLSKFNMQIVLFLKHGKNNEIAISNDDEYKYTKINNKSVRIKQVILKFLQRIDLITRTRNYSTGYSDNNYKAHSRHFIINTDFINNDVVKILLKEKKTKELNRKYISDRIDLCYGNVIAESQLKMIYKFNELDREKLYQRGLDYVIKKSYKGNNFVEFNNEKTAKSKSLENHMMLYSYIMENGLLIPIVKEDSGRVFTSFNLIPSWIRDSLTINGKKTIGVDISKSVPSIINMMFGGAEINYDKFNKYDIIKFLFSDNYKAKNYYKEIYNDFYTNNRQLLETITAIKESIGSSTFAKMIYKIESDVMTNSILELNKKHINVYYVFDELICEEKNYSVVKKTIQYNLDILKIKTTAK
jgi:hypothetical protein